jgi:predicted N-acyltransferase
MTKSMSKRSKASDLSLRVFDSPALIDAAEWNALLDLQPSSTPFMRHEYLSALQDSGSATSDAGWTAQFLAFFEPSPDDSAAPGTEVLSAACPLYLKDHSYGEYEIVCRHSMLVQAKRKHSSVRGLPPESEDGKWSKVAG